MNRHITDDALLQLYLQRSEQAIVCTAEKYGNYLYTIAYNILADRDECQECQNDTYLAAWYHIPPDAPRAFAPYLSKIIRNLALDRYRAHTRQKRIPTHALSGLEELGELAGGTDQEKVLDSTLFRLLMNRFVRGLSRRERYIFICRYYCGDAATQIADTLKISRSAVDKTLAKLRSRLRTLLEKEGIGL